MLQKFVDAPRNLAGFYSDVKTELKKVTWPGRKEVYNTTLVVLVTVFFFGLYLFLIDAVLQAAVRQIFEFFL